GFKALVEKYRKALGDATGEASAPAAPAADAPAGIQSVAPAPQRPMPVVQTRSNRPFTSADYELIRDEAALVEWIAEATNAGAGPFACQAAPSHAVPVGLGFALLEGPWGNVNSGRRRAAYLPLGHRAPGSAQGALDLGGGQNSEKSGGDGALLAGQL